jgi:hypothetical protein
MAALDLDGSGRISLEEHYFRVFADADADGALSPAEYDASVYPAGGFADHDLNADGAVTFVERKFIAAASLGSGESGSADAGRRRTVAAELSTLSYSAWYYADLPAEFLTFSTHAVAARRESTTSAAVAAERVGLAGYARYVLYFRCAARAAAPYVPPASSRPWLGACPLVGTARGSPPWVEANANGIAGGGYLPRMWDVISSRLLWNATPTAVVPEEVGVNVEAYLGPPPVGGPEFGRMSIGLLAAWKRLNSSRYLCSRSFGAFTSYFCL